MEQTDLIGKRVNLTTQNLKRLKILTMLFENDTNGLNEKKKLDYAINKAIESFYSSKEVKELLEL
jgi:hypothetical protein